LGKCGWTNKISANCISGLQFRLDKQIWALVLNFIYTKKINSGSGRTVGKYHTSPKPCTLAATLTDDTDTNRQKKLEYIKTIFDRLYNEPFPSERGKEVHGVDLVLVDSDTMGLTTCFLGNKGHLTTDQINMLSSCYADLNKIIPQLDKHERQYFASLRHLAKEMLEATSAKNLSDNEISKRHQWKKVYNQIKDIVNELDPLGVADIVDDEYDDLNFRIYSQLLIDREDSKVCNSIQTMLSEYYGVTVAENDLTETVKKLNAISLNN
jgi:hypothetical protein